MGGILGFGDGYPRLIHFLLKRLSPSAQERRLVFSHCHCFLGGPPLESHTKEALGCVIFPHPFPLLLDMLSHTSYTQSPSPENINFHMHTFLSFSSFSQILSPCSRRECGRGNTHLDLHHLFLASHSDLHSLSCTPCRTSTIPTHQGGTFIASGRL